ncbi:zf-U1-domain-containing protein [Gigaspora margarita]|uniref:U1 small nuclear ribonucleoprotein C n=1 Tax=Gigaspora margarita TaxID=4874 RepID=A0A8H3XJD7_GIGMA|nr:zf-U1-domain-containing protein [Gigaspora margarita]
MPKYYCDYCDVYLTHDSSSVRKAHNNGKNHIMNVRNYYAELGQDKAQAIIDEITKAYECAGQVGFPPQYGYIPGMIPTVVAPVVNASPYTQVPPPLMMPPRPPVGNGAPGTVAASVPMLNAPPPPPPVIGGPGIGTTVPPNPLPPTPTGVPSTLPTQQPFTGQPPSSAFVRPGGLGTPGVLSFQLPQGAPASSGNVPQPETSSPPSSGNMQTGPSPPGALPPPGGSASFNAPNLPPQYPPGQPPRGVKRQMEE